MSLIQEIENLLFEDADDFLISKTIKTYIKNYKNSLNETFEENQGKDFLVKHTKELDNIITLLYKITLRKMFGNYLPMRNHIPIALVALGSYGREQLSVYSDVDLMLVYKDIQGFNTKAIIEKFLYLVWDTGLKLGHRVHAINDLQVVAEEDITIKTALIESRFICGSKFTWHACERELHIIRTTNQKEFLLQKLEEANLRRRKYPTSMQPHIKEGVGGLRDAQLIFWMSRIIYGVNGSKDLVGLIYDEASFRDFRISLEFLYKVRNALHLVAKKQQDILALDLIPYTYKKLGFKEQRSFVTKTLHSLDCVNRFSKIYSQKMIRALMHQETDFKRLKEHRVIPYLYRFEDQFYSTYKKVGVELLDFLRILNREDKDFKFGPSILYILKQMHIPKQMTKEFSQEIIKLFYKKNLYGILHLFLEAGVLGKIITPFNKILFLAQFDGYHQYSVDIHSVECMKAFENFYDTNMKMLFESLSEDDKAFIKLVTLLHDTGKGRKQDHSEVGAKLFNQFAKTLGLESEKIQQGIRLIKHHTLMSNVAQREDFYNERVLLSFVSKVKDTHTLKLLYILTYADMSGVGDNIYNSFNAKILKDLYQHSLEVIDNTHLLTEVKKRDKKIASLKRHQRFQGLSRLKQKKVLSIESNLFFIKQSIEEILDAIEHCNELEEYNYFVNNDAYLSLEIYRKRPINLSYLLGQLKNLEVGSMMVYKLYDGIKFFKIEFIDKLDEVEFELLNSILEHTFDMKHNVRLKQPQILPHEIEFECNYSNQHSKLQIHTKNQKGLLAYIVKVLDDLNVDIVSAKVHTIKNRARDLFLIEKREEFCNNTEIIINKLSQKA